MNWKRYRFVLLLAKRDILEDRKISLIVIAMLSFSFLNLTFFPAFIQGLSGSFTQNIVETQTGHVLIEADEGRLKNPDSLVRKIKGLPGVKEVEKRLEFSSSLLYRGNQVTAPTIGTSTPESEVYRSRVVEGEGIRKGADRMVLIGSSLAEGQNELGDEGLDVTRGRKVKMVALNNSLELKVAGKIGRPGPGTVIRQVFVKYETAEEILEAEGEASSVKVLLDDRSQAEEFKQRLKRLNVGGEIQTWREVSDVAQSINSTFSIVTGVVSLVGLIVAVTSIGVVIFINTNKRSRETGIVRSFGAERSEVMYTFVLEALIFGLAGVVIGNILMVSVHLALNLNPLQTPIGELSTVLSQNLLVTRSIWLLAAALVAGLIPAYLVSQKNIVETIEQR